MKPGLSLSLAACATAALLLLASCKPGEQQHPAKPSVEAPQAPSAHERPVPAKAKAVVDAARERTRLGERYDPSYFTIGFPGGDVPNDRGVCSDVVVRAYRAIGLDLQVLVHDDMSRAFDAYPRMWGLTRTDRNIDHRRVPNLRAFFTRKGASLPVTASPDDYRPGDLVTWTLPRNLPHIGIVSDRFAPGTDRPLILHNIGTGTSEDDVLFAYPIAGHYRYYPDGARGRLSP